MNENDEDAIPVFLYSGSNDAKMYFDFLKLEAYGKDIAYMYGQIKSVHMHEQYISLANLAIMYDGNSWIKNKASFMKFIYLGIASSLISGIGKKTGNVLKLKDKPTLSPDDSNFDRWWAEHRAEWED